MVRRAALRRITIVAIAFVCAPGISMAWAQDSSPWKTELHAAARLIAGAPWKLGGTVWLRAGVEIRLDPGWHTYWRSPGDSGVSPTFDFAGSQNIKSVTILWPAPKRFADGLGGHFNGYVGDVVFPLRIAPKDTIRSSSLHLKLRYAFCKDACFPSAADLALKLSGNSGAEEQALVVAEARVPRHVVLGAAAGLVIRSVHRKVIGERARVTVEVTAPQGRSVDLFVEGPTPDWALPTPQRADPASGDPSDVRKFQFDLVGLPPGAQTYGATLTFTAVTIDDAIEVDAPLD